MHTIRHRTQVAPLQRKRSKVHQGTGRQRTDAASQDILTTCIQLVQGDEERAEGTGEANETRNHGQVDNDQKHGGKASQRATS